MATVIHNINVGIGDCFLIISDNKSIMVDCGKFNSNVKKILEDNSIEKLDLVIATHIDNDHISGLCDLLNEIQVDNILFNGFHHIPIERSTNAPYSVSDKVFNHLKNYNSYFRMNKTFESHVDAEESLSLSETIIKKNISWNKFINGERLSFDNKNQFESNGIKIQILSPCDEQLKKTYSEYRKFIYEKTGEMLAKDKLEDLTRSLYDIAMREDSVSSYEHSINAVLPLTLNSVYEYANEGKKTDTSIANRASLAFILEVEGKKILMLGDAHPDIVSNNLKQLYGGQKVIFDAIKISHHGSSKNTTSELLNLIDSHIYIFSGGDNSKKPSEYTISKIITQKIPNAFFTDRILYFNRNTNRIVNNFVRNSYLQKQLAFRISYNQTQIIL